MNGALPQIRVNIMELGLGPSLYDELNVPQYTADELINLQAAFVNSSKLMMAAIHPNGKFLFVNQSAAESVGYTVDEIMDGGISFVHPEEAREQILAEQVSRVMNNGETWRAQCDVIKKDGSIYPVEFTSFPVRSKEGAIIAIAIVFEDITERRQMEAMNQWHLAIMESSQDYISVANLEKQVIYNSPGAFRMMGQKTRAGNGLDLLITDVHSPEYAQTVRDEGIPTAMREGAWRGRGDLTRKDGTKIPIEQSIFPVLDPRRELMGVGTIIRDISETVKNEQKMNERLLHQNILSEIAMSSIRSTDFEQLVNDAMALLSELLQTEKMLFLLDDPDKKQFVGRYEKVFDPAWATVGQPYSYIGSEELYAHVMNSDFVFFPDASALPRKSQVIFPNSKSILLVPMMIENELIGLLYCGTITRLAHWTEQELAAVKLASGILSNAFGRDNSNKRLEGTQGMLRSIIDNSPGGIFWKDLNLRYLGANRSYAQTVGMNSPGDLTGKQDRDFLEPMWAARLEEEDRHIIETGREVLYREERNSAVGHPDDWISISKILLRNDDGQPMGILGLCDDITQRKHNEERLEEAILLATEASSAKSDFLSRMSHEIRTPMNAIIGMTKIGQTTDDPQRMQYCLEKINDASRHLLSLINDILDMSKIESGRLELVEEGFDFERMLENVCNVIGLKSEEKHQNLFVNVSQNMPRRVVGDELRLAQVLTNLLSNAVKFTPDKGNIKLEIKLLPKGESGESVMYTAVTDSGIGISPEQQTKLFTSFEQAEGSIARRFGGTGLGLAISKKIVELMGGHIGVRSEVGQGSCFFFTANLTPDDNTIRRVVYDKSVYSSLRVLVVDDDFEVLDYFKRVLADFEMCSDYASSGEEAMSLAQAASAAGAGYDIVFVDYLMEDMDGIATTCALKQIIGNSVHVIMISISDWSAVENAATAAGIARFIQKPLFRSSIFNAINELVIRKGIWQEGSLLEASQGQTFSRCHLLLVEDIEINREIALTLLEDTLLNIECAETGQAALQMFEANPNKYDLILMDIQMPVMDGLTATRRIRALPHPRAALVPIVAMTANAFKEDVDACKAAGMWDHISKPIDVEELHMKVGRYLMGKEDR